MTDERRSQFDTSTVLGVIGETRSTSQKRPPPSARFFASFFLRRPRREKSPSSLDRRQVAPRLLAPSPPHPLSLQKCNRTIERSRRIGREEESGRSLAMAMRATGRLRLPVFATVPRGPVHTHTRARALTHLTHVPYARARTHPHAKVRLHATHYVCTPSLSRIHRASAKRRSFSLSFSLPFARTLSLHASRTHARMCTDALASVVTRCSECIRGESAVALAVTASQSGYRATNSPLQAAESGFFEAGSLL